MCIRDRYNALKGESAKKYKNSFSTTYTHSYHRSMASNDPNYEISESHNINHILTKQAIIEWVKTDNQHVRFFYRDNDLSLIHIWRNLLQIVHVLFSLLRV